ncbi:hypothetical protein MJO29_011619 [Puccinia striiformis f. sp. tritici]|uniref:Uncharacterized protein n=1 Tax=Puccinia striiformis f. sp. tritici PST-78 TaxID=1165861 RepID=A0A0L0VZZ0_9BASI|nr:hypothetical protein Pst134EA_021432 [Puccinia striiformis f. sp. tritici]KAH9457559.1 hypothetical protein Pst134EA_021432 [Puccinia striiformis f. sp. tritici]KAI7947092.1 hypothetical protein MJO29_011619 [Puccinia striiformis f. sp. tritici]KNF04838.1 hypothetical protein PSTG_01893 [Puccinia striiformis f. sp. tritici PST-78]KNF04839.1 hypothetical protein, variant [Puccinia striiformis f. sp. tritici PST-78]
MSHTSITAVPNRPCRVSSRAAMSSNLPLVASGNLLASRIPMPPVSEHNPGISSSPQSAHDSRNDPDARPPLTIQINQARTDDLAAEPHMPHLVSPKHAPNRGMYRKLKSVKSFFKRQTTGSDDESSEGYDTGRGADPSTNSEPVQLTTSSNIGHGGATDPSPSIRSASRPKVARSPLLLESFGPARDRIGSMPVRAKSDFSQQLDPARYDVKTEPQVQALPTRSEDRLTASKDVPNKQLIRTTRHNDHGCQPPAQPASGHPPPLVSRVKSIHHSNRHGLSKSCSSRKDSALPRSHQGLRERVPHQSLDAVGARPPPGLRQVVSNSSITAPRGTGVPEAHPKEGPPTYPEAQPPRTDSSHLIDYILNDYHDLTTPEMSDISLPSISMTTSEEQTEEYEEGDQQYEDYSILGISDLKYNQTTSTFTSDAISFEINVAQEVKSTAVRKLLLKEPRNTSLGASISGSSGGSSVRSGSLGDHTNTNSVRSDSLGDHTHSGSIHDDNIPHSPCSSAPSFESRQSQNSQEYVNIIQIRHVLNGLHSLLEKLDAQDELPDPMHRAPSNRNSSSVNFRISQADFLQMIKHELDR